MPSPKSFSGKPSVVAARARKIKLGGVYLAKIGRRQEQDIWIVDGPTVRRDIYDEFLYGGNDQRYRFVPADEVWIDNCIGVEELEYTILHELHERHLMKTQGLSYDKAHNSALMVELRARRKAMALDQLRELNQSFVTPTDLDHVKEIPDIGDKVALREVYRAKLGQRYGNNVWVVDGAHVRRDLFPDFDFAGNDRQYQFIPRNEIWIDAQLGCVELEYQIMHAAHFRAFLALGIDEGTAYGQATDVVTKARRSDLSLDELKEQMTAPVELGSRARGVKRRRATQRRRLTAARRKHHQA